MTVLAGENVGASVRGVHERPPEGWEEALRSVSPITDAFSHLRFFWYKARARWVLYDCVPAPLIHEDELQGGPITGRELVAFLNGPPPRELEEWARCPFVSDAQHEFWRVYKVYARPFWVLQGELGGHQVAFDRWQQDVLRAKQLPVTPPVIGELAPAPFDNRALNQLRHLNRLHHFAGRLDKLRQSGSAEAAQAQMDAIGKEVRAIETAFVESQMAESVEASMALTRGHNPQSYLADGHLITLKDQASRSSDALQEYLETGNFSL